MCLIITGKSKTIIDTLLDTPGLLRDILDSNGDGLGAMYVTSKRVLRTPKIVTSDPLQAIGFIKQLPADDREMAIHFRMKTHGHIDLTNCHPYTVLPDQLAMMHNGVISWVDDTSDLSKSDTWHYIEQFMKPMLQASPQLFLVPAFQEVIEEHIGTGNRFVFMDKEGNLAILNRRTGIEHGGMWFSNTYAWSPELLIPGYKKKWTAYGSYVAANDDDDDELWGYNGASVGNVTTGDVRMDALYKDFEQAVAYSDADEVEKMLGEFPISTTGWLLKHYEFSCHIEPEHLSEPEAKICDMLEKGMAASLQGLMHQDPVARRRVAECIAYYGEWEEREEPAPNKQPGKWSALTSTATATPATTSFEVGKVYRTRDGSSMRRVVSIDLALGNLLVEPVEDAEGVYLPRTNRCLDGRIANNNAIFGLDIVMPAISNASIELANQVFKEDEEGEQPEAAAAATEVGELDDARQLAEMYADHDRHQAEIYAG